MASQGEIVVEKCLSIISEETGVPRDELDEETDFADLGINHTLARAIVNHISRVTSLTLSTDIFETYPDVSGFVDHIYALSPTSSTRGSSEALVKDTPSNVAASPVTSKSQGKQPLLLLLQGSPAIATKTIFLLPDGSGSAMSYARIPTLGQDLALYGLNSPHLGTGLFEDTIPGLAAVWTEKIIETQSRGPYILGGWSAGGFYATEVARLLLARGERVESIVIIDSPCRLEYGAPPIEVFEFLAGENKLGSFPKGVPTWLMDHFAGTMTAVGGYDPAPVLGVPKIYIIESADGVLVGEEEAEDSGVDLTEGVSRMLLLPRGEFSTGGWDRQFPGAEVRWARMTGSHFTVVQPPHVKMLGSLLRDAVTGIADEQDSWSLW